MTNIVGFDKLTTLIMKIVMTFVTLKCNIFASFIFEITSLLNTFVIFGRFCVDFLILRFRHFSTAFFALLYKNNRIKIFYCLVRIGNFIK